MARTNVPVGLVRRAAVPQPKRKRGGPRPDTGRRTAAGPPFVVRWHPAAEAERDASWPPQEQVAMFNAVEKLQAAGARLPFPHSSAVQGASGKGFRELRPRGGRSRWRPIYRQVTSTTFVVLAVGPEAAIDKAGFDAALRRAVQRFAEIELDGA
jgi:hypothetical protein